jgi:hypothetical protein
MMMYRGPFDAEETRIVANSLEEATALAEGWNHSPAKHPPSQYPLNMVEVGRDSWPGLGPRGSDYRKVLLHSSAEEQTFWQVVDPKLWRKDAKFMWGGLWWGSRNSSLSTPPGCTPI